MISREICLPEFLKISSSETVVRILEPLQLWNRGRRDLLRRLASGRKRACFGALPLPGLGRDVSTGRLPPWNDPLPHRFQPFTLKCAESAEALVGGLSVPTHCVPSHLPAGACKVAAFSGESAQSKRNRWTRDVLHVLGVRLAYALR